VGLPAFLALCAGYFTMAYMLLGAMFLGIGGLAGSMREVQMLSMPITFFQVGMFGLSAAAAGKPGSSLARFAEWFPFSSPFAMAARAANDATLWVHFAALAWQLFWVALTIWLAARLFRVGVLKAGSWKSAFGLKG
jgi:ABC-2 type transport system permease protein